MSKKKLKVTVVRGEQEKFESFCKKHEIYFRVYPLPILNNVYRAECEEDELSEIKDILIKVEDMPKVVCS